MWRNAKCCQPEMRRALPYTISFTILPLIALAAMFGGWALTLPFIGAWVVVTLLDRALGLDTSNFDPSLPAHRFFWHRAVTWAWVPAQFAMIVGCLWAVSLPGHLGTGEKVALMAGLGVATGGIGITYAHELIHRRPRWERLLGEILLVSTGYGHFATEHLHGHHVTVATPADPVTARRGESFWAFLPRAVIGSLLSAWRLDRQRLHRRGRPVWHPGNPFWRYAGGFAAMLAMAYGIGGWSGIGLYLVMCAMGVYQLEAVNYVEHYGLTRRHLGDGKFERTALHHSWNASHRISNALLINLQRHSDHHARPDRPFPLLQNHPWKSAPQLPFGYPAMVFAALIPPLWFRIMNPRLERWRQQFYPDISDWRAYDDGTVGAPSDLAGAA